jgi:hypothetical protein
MAELQIAGMQKATDMVAFVFPVLISISSVAN